MQVLHPGAAELEHAREALMKVMELAGPAHADVRQQLDIDEAVPDDRYVEIEDGLVEAIGWIVENAEEAYRAFAAAVAARREVGR